MKKMFSLLFLCGAVQSSLLGQSMDTDAPTASNTNLFVSRRGADSRVWSTITTRTNPDGTVFTRTNAAYTEIGGG